MDSSTLSSSLFTALSGPPASRRRPPLKLHCHVVSFSSPATKLSVRTSAISGGDNCEKPDFVISVWVICQCCRS